MQVPPASSCTLAAGSKRGCGLRANTTMTLRTRDEEPGGGLFCGALARSIRVTRRSLSMERWKFFGYERYEETGRAVDVQATGNASA